MTTTQLLWSDKFAPKTLEECVLTPKHTERFGEFISSGNLPHLILVGAAGMGKTTIARILCDLMEMDFLLINASDENGIDTIRNQVRGFASTTSLLSGGKVVLLDEADNLTADAQMALRGMVEQFQHHCRFILTANYEHRISAPLKSRMVTIQFSDSSGLNQAMVERAQTILTSEGVEHTEEDVASLVEQHSPNWRQVIHQLQQQSLSGTLVVDKKTTTPEAAFIQAIKDRDVPLIARWVREHTANGGSTLALANTLTTHALEQVSPHRIPEVLFTISSVEGMEVGDTTRHQLTLATQVMEVWG